MEPNYYDAIVIGGGPSGLFAALELSKYCNRVALIDKGGYMDDSLCPKVRAHVPRSGVKIADRFRSQCSRCTCLQGIGGAAFHFDSNLGYARRLSRSKVEVAQDGSVQLYSQLERVLGSFEVAEELIAEVFDTFAKYGLDHPPNPDGVLYRDVATLSAPRFTHVDTAESLPVELDTALQLIRRIEQSLVANRAEILTWTTVDRLEPGERSRWSVHAIGRDGLRQVLEANSVILAVGKPGLTWVQEQVKHLGVAYQTSTQVDVGVRLETLRSDLLPLTTGCHNPKLTFLSRRSEPVRTFCVCDGGRLMQYEMAGVTILDGQHCIHNPTRNSNLGILTSVTLGTSADATEFALAFARLVNAIGGSKPVVQRIEDFTAGRGTTSLSGGSVQTSLVQYALGDLGQCLPQFLMHDIADMLARLEETYPGSVRADALLVAPIIERIYPNIQLDKHFQTSKPGLFIVGDSSSKLMGITYGAASGLRAARAILEMGHRASGLRRDAMPRA